MSITVTKRPYSNSFSGNPVYYQLYSDAAVSDSTIYFEVQVKFKTVNGSYAAVLDNPIPFFPVAGFADVDIKDILHAQLQYGLIPFYVDEKTPWVADLQSGFYYIEFREITTANASPRWDTSESSYERFVAKGGINFWQYRGNNWWVNYQPVQKPFLTWQNSGRLAAYAERMYLAWLQLDDIVPGLLIMKAKAFFTDGSNATRTVSVTEAQYKVHYLPVGAAQLDLQALGSSKTIHYWEVWLDAGGTAVSEVVRYYRDNRTDYKQTTLHYRNSLGGLDSVRILGEIEEAATYSFTEQETAIEPDYFSGDSIQPQRRIADNTEQITFKGNTGPLTKEEQDRLRDLFIIREVYQAIDKKWWPVVIVTKNFTLRKTGDQRWSLPVDWELAYSGGDYYTPRSENLGDGVFTSNVCLAKLSPITTSVDRSGSDAAVTINGTEDDPQAASTQVQYQVETTSGTVVIAWTTVLYSALPVVAHVPKDEFYKVRARSICTNSVTGVVTEKYFNTFAPGGSVGTNSSIQNHTSTSTTYQVLRNGVEVANDNLGSYGFDAFDVADGSGLTVEVTLAFSPASAKLTNDGDGTVYTGSIAGNTVTFTGVTLSGGCFIEIG